MQFITNDDEPLNRRTLYETGLLLKDIATAMAEKDWSVKLSEWMNKYSNDLGLLERDPVKLSVRLTPRRTIPTPTEKAEARAYKTRMKNARTSALLKLTAEEREALQI